MNIRIMTDSTCDLSPAYLQAHDVTVIPLTVNLDGKSYADDGVAITRQIQRIFDAQGLKTQVLAASFRNTRVCPTDAMRRPVVRSHLMIRLSSPAVTQ